MKNKTTKTNKTRFDYQARKLGMLGLFFIAVTCVVGGIGFNKISLNNLQLTNVIEHQMKNELRELRKPYKYILNKDVLKKGEILWEKTLMD